MRTSVYLGVLMAGLTLTGAASAQTAFGASMSGQNRLSSPQSTGSLSTINFLGSGFRLRDLFGVFRSTSTRTNIGYSSVPNPNSPEYLQAFGYKKLF